MNSKILVMDYNDALLSRMQKQRLVVRMSVPDMISEVNSNL